MLGHVPEWSQGAAMQPLRRFSLSVASGNESTSLVSDHILQHPTKPGNVSNLNSFLEQTITGSQYDI
jgi:hypothetical protein